MKKKGRNSNLIELRNKKLCERYCYWYGVLKVRHDETLRILSQEEFFLSEQRIWAIIKESKGILSTEAMAEAQKPKVKALRGVPTSLKVVSEYSYALFPSAETP